MIQFNDIECKSGVARAYPPTGFGGSWEWRGEVEFKFSQQIQELLIASEYIGPLYGMPDRKIDQIIGDVYITSLIFGENEQGIKGVKFEGTGAPKVKGKPLEVPK
uniref:Uncharacterized protein n=1 Tax=viral metagenome TaxID=1070528 RepID=A0A6M3JTV2_9ZZZZ